MAAITIAYPITILRALTIESSLTTPAAAGFLLRPASAGITRAPMAARPARRCFIWAGSSNIPAGNTADARPVAVGNNHTPLFEMPGAAWCAGLSVASSRQPVDWPAMWQISLFQQGRHQVSNRQKQGYFLPVWCVAVYFLWPEVSGWTRAPVQVCRAAVPVSIHDHTTGRNQCS